MRQIEIHHTGINAHSEVNTYYGIDYQTKEVLFKNIEKFEDAWDLAISLGYSESEICRMF